MDRESRQRCWFNRDAFFSCLDKHDIQDPIKERDAAERHCPSERLGFEANCVATWVDYFSKKRVLERQREEMIREAERRGTNVLSAADVRRESIPPIPVPFFPFPCPKISGGGKNRRCLCSEERTDSFVDPAGRRDSA